MPSDTTMITIPLSELEGLFGVASIALAEAAADVRGDLILLSDADQSYTVTLTRNNVSAHYTDGPLPEGKMTPVITSRKLMITFE